MASPRKDYAPAAAKVQRVPIPGMLRLRQNGPKTYDLISTPRNLHIKEQLAHKADVNIFWSDHDKAAFEALDPRNKHKEERLVRYGRLRRFPALISPRMMPSEGGDSGYKSAMPPLERLTQLTSSSAVKARSKVNIEAEPTWNPTGASAKQALERIPSLFETPYLSARDHEHNEYLEEREKCPDPLRWRGIVAGCSYRSRIMTEDEVMTMREIIANKDESQKAWNPLMEEYWLRLKGYQAELAAEPVPEVVKSMARAEVLAKHGRRQYVGGR